MDLFTLFSPDSSVAALGAANKGQLLAELARRASSATGTPTLDIQDGLLARVGPWCPFNFPHFGMLVLSYAGIALPSAKDCWQINGQYQRCPMAHLAIPLPPTFVAWLWPYLVTFAGRTRSTVAALAVGAVLAVGPRTVANLLRTLGLADDPGFATFHRVLNRNRWSGRKLARTLLNALVSAFVPNGPIVIGVDHTLENRRGTHVRPVGHCFDSVRSSTERTVTSRGLRWMNAMLPVEGSVCRPHLGTSGTERAGAEPRLV